MGRNSTLIHRAAAMLSAARRLRVEKVRWHKTDEFLQAMLRGNVLSLDARLEEIIEGTVDAGKSAHPEYGGDFVRLAEGAYADMRRLVALDVKLVNALFDGHPRGLEELRRANERLLLDRVIARRSERR